MRRLLLASCCLCVLVTTTARAAEVTGRVTMPDVCSPAVSPAVVTLVPVSAEGGTPDAVAQANAVADVALINQEGLQFAPRVQAIALGQSVQFTNADNETHNVHVGNDFNESMSPGQPRRF